MIILSTDPGLANFGWSVIDSDTLSILDCGITRTEASNSDGKRLSDIYNFTKGLFDRFDIEFVVYEQIYQGFRPGQTTQALRVSKVICLIEMLADERGIPVASYTTQQIKKEVAGSGKSSKEEVEEAVGIVFNVEIPKSKNHMSDAIGAGLCFIRKRNQLIGGVPVATG